MKPYYADDAVTLFHGDSRDVLPTLSGVDLVVTDPPYAFGLASTAQEGKAGGWGDLMNNALFYGFLLREFKRLTVNRQGAAWVFNSWRSLPTLARGAFEAEWGIESLLVWDKEWIGPGGPRGLRPSYEVAALFAQPDFALGNRGLPDIWRCKWAGSSRTTGHPAEKPVALLSRLIVESVQPSTVVLDPFAGSGSTLVAAKNHGRRAIGIEVEEKWCEVAANRLRQDGLALPVEAA